MIYLKTVSDGYITSVVKAETVSNLGGIKITEAEYSDIQNAMKSIPSAVDGYARKLLDGTLEWELVKLPPVEPEPPTDEEALTRYANELTGADDPDLLSAAETMITKLAREES